MTKIRQEWKWNPEPSASVVSYTTQDVPVRSQLASTLWFCPRDVITGTRGRRYFIPIIGIDPNHNDGEQPMTEETFRCKREDQMVSVKNNDVACNDVACNDVACNDVAV
jgi:hypothetical protein